MQLIEKNSWNENPDKVIDIVEEILKFNKQQKRKGLEIQTGTSTSTGRWYIWNLIKRNLSNHLFLVSSKRNY